MTQHVVIDYAGQLRLALLDAAGAAYRLAILAANGHCPQWLAQEARNLQNKVEGLGRADHA